MLSLLKPLNYVKNQSLTGAADFAAEQVDVGLKVGYAIQAEWTSTSALTGTLKLQASNDGNVWSDLPSSQAIAGSSGSFIWNNSDIFYQYVRLFYAHTSGTGTLNANLIAKG